MKRLEYEPELAFLADLTQPEDTVIDVGANFGVYALVLADRVKSKGRVYAFEPGEEALRQLRVNCGLNPALSVQIVPVALAEREGEAALFHSGGAPTTFSLSQDEGFATERVPLVTLDSWAEQVSLARFDLLKIDVEGYEPNVFKGASKTLRRFKPLIMFEISSSALARNGTQGSEPFGLLSALGYEIYRHAGGGLTPISLAEDGNLFAVHPESEWPHRLAGRGVR